jgi:hypothetical protein
MPKEEIPNPVDAVTLPVCRIFATFCASAFVVNEPPTLQTLGPIDLDPDPHGSALIWLFLIRIQIRIGNADPDPGAWKLTKNDK